MPRDARRDATTSDAPPGVGPTLPGGLVYVNDGAMPGITRERSAEGFEFRLPGGKLLDDAAEIARIRKLAIPPAYTDVWICPLANGHLQATGRDARGRKQYRYHADWNAQRGADKFARLEAFGRALPKIRRRVARDLARDDGVTASHAVVMATLVRLLDTTFLRIGNEAYARENHSYGLTTLRNRHAGISGSRLRLSFRGKSGVRHEVSIDDRRVARVVRRCQQLPGQELFQYESGGELRAVGSADVNDYIADAAGERFTAKDFRTWHATVLALELTQLACSPGVDGAASFSAQQVIAQVARRLGNTVAVCRKAYVHPAVLLLGQRLASDSEALAAYSRTQGALPAGRELRAAERRLLHFLREHEKSLRKEAARAARTKTATKDAPRRPRRPR